MKQYMSSGGRVVEQEWSGGSVAAGTCRAEEGGPSRVVDRSGDDKAGLFLGLEF